MREKASNDEAKLLFSVAMLAGEILLSSGAEIYRVEDTIERILGISGYEGTESFVTPTCILMTLRDPEAETITSLRRVTVRENNLSRVASTNTVARHLVDGEISLTDAAETLNIIKRSAGFPSWVHLLTLLFLPVCFYLFFRGTNPALMAVCMVTGLWLAVARAFLFARIPVRFFRDLISAAGVAFLASAASSFFSPGTEAVNLVIISSIMPLVPGVAITTAIRDVLHGDYQSGTARAAEAFIIATASAVGVGTGLFLFRLIFT